MAKLEGTDFRGKKGFGIRLLPPAIVGEDSTEYEIEYWTESDEEPTVNRFSINGWQSEHVTLWLIARQFAFASKLIDVTVPMSRISSKTKEHACVYRYCDWLRVVMFATSRPGNNRICVEFYIQDGDRVGTYKRHFLNCSVSAAQQFGREFEQEIIAAAPRWRFENRYGEDNPS